MPIKSSQVWYPSHLQTPVESNILNQLVSMWVDRNKISLLSMTVNLAWDKIIDWKILKSKLECRLTDKERDNNQGEERLRVLLIM